MSQEIFKFEQQHDYLPENFLVSDSNREAFEAAQSFTKKSYALNIYGPKSSGKTYLAYIAKEAAGDKIVHVYEDINSKTYQHELLHLLNYAKENGQYVLLTSEDPVTKMHFQLADLTSRLNAIDSVGIHPPDDELLYMLFARLFAARQLKVSDDVLSYLTSRTDRSFEAAADIVHKLDSLSLMEKRNITVSLIKKIIK